MSAADLSGGNVVQLSGPVTLYESTEIRELLLSTLAEGRDVVVDLETSGPWDLSGLQLLVAAVASARKMGLAIRFAQVPKVCAEIAERCGLEVWLRDLTDSFL
jgi:anti-anti-sigma regulatory factor